ncbi:MAG TPA: LptF/LptG family permease [Kiritimatiellia bacterium]|nr:LptF/LptG family permease [Kiritimatiellia bacterium]
MRTLQRYILADYLVIFFMTLSVFTFVMCVGVIVKAIDIAARGISAELIGRLFLLNIPYMMTFSIPISVLTACLLLFGRLSFDGELTAMRACGLSLWQIVAPLIVMSVIFTGVCMYINASVAPRCKALSREILMEMGVEEPINLLEVGRFVQDFPNMQIFIRSRDGDVVRDIVVYETDDGKPVRNVRADEGRIRVEKEERIMYIDLYNVRIDQTDRSGSREAPKSHYINAQYYPVKIDFSSFAGKARRKKPSDMAHRELIENIRDVKAAFPDFKPKDLLRQRMFMVVEMNKRFAVSMSCFAFTLIGIPLGMKSRRKESSVGVGIALALVFAFYLFIIIANSLVGSPELRPDLIVWLPVVVCELIGFYLIYRAA